jgi:hypothetical protein
VKTFYLFVFLCLGPSGVLFAVTPTDTPTQVITATPTVTVTFTTTPTYTPAATLNPTAEASLSGNTIFIYPDPAKAPGATIAVAMKEDGLFKVTVYNLNGDTVLWLEERLPPGTGQVPIRLDKVPPGIYLYRGKISYDSGASEDTKLLKFRVIP